MGRKKKSKHITAKYQRQTTGSWLWPNQKEAAKVIVYLMDCLRQIKTPAGKEAYIEAHSQWKRGRYGQRICEKV